MAATVQAFAESLLWFSRRLALDAPLWDLRQAWEQRFLHQERWFIRHGAPKLRAAGLFEAARKPPRRAGIEEAVNTLDDFTDGLAVRAFDRTIPLAFAAGAQQTARDVGSVISFDIRNPLVLEYLRQHSAEKLGRDVDATTKDRIRTLLTRGYEESWTYRRTVKEIRALYDGFRVRTGRGINRMSRAEIIATNELGTAYSQGALRFGAQLEETGLEIEKAWFPSGSACPEICLPNAGAGWIPLRRQFPSGHDAPTGHPVCRCGLATRAVARAA